MSEYDLSIVLPVYNDQKNLHRILDELSANSPDETWEVIVIDDGSTDALKLTDSPPGHWHLYRQDTRRGAACARNAGVKRARGEHVVLLSAFLKIPKNYITRIRSFIKENQFDVAQHLLAKPQELQADHFQEFLVNQSERTTETRGVLPVKNTLFTAAIITQNLFSELGGFDEKMNHYGGHELDLAYRLDQKGYSSRVLVKDLPLERVRLESHDSIRARLLEYGRVGLPSLLKKHPELKRDILIQPLLWGFASAFGIPKRLENQISKNIDLDRKLARYIYRLYLHLIVRNAWAAR